MKLSKIRGVCKACKQIRLLTADELVDNMVTQWIGTDHALYPVTGVLLNLPTLGVLWELGDRLVEMDAAEGRCSDMVERGLLSTLDAEVLMRVPAQVDTTTIPEIQMGEINGYLAMACGPELIAYVKEWLLEPCRGMGRLSYDHVSGAGNAQWVAVYADGRLVGLIRPESQGAADIISRQLRAMAQREPCGV